MTKKQTPISVPTDSMSTPRPENRHRARPVLAAAAAAALLAACAHDKGSSTEAKIPTFTNYGDARIELESLDKAHENESYVTQDVGEAIEDTFREALPLLEVEVAGTIDRLLKTTSGYFTKRVDVGWESNTI